MSPTADPNRDPIADEDDDSDLPPGPHLKPMEMTPALRKVLDQMKERLAEREQDQGDE